MPASRIFRLARTRRWAIVASGTRKARAIQCLVAGRGDDPAARVGRHPRGRPALRGHREGLLDRLLGEVDVAEEAGQGGHRTPRALPVGPLDGRGVRGVSRSPPGRFGAPPSLVARSSLLSPGGAAPLRLAHAHGTIYSSGASSWNGRTSTGPPQASDPLAAHSSAASRSSALITQKPPSCSLVSANGPSVVTTWPPCARTTVAVEDGCRPPANTHAPADWTSALKASTALYICAVSASEGAGAPSTICTASMYCLMSVLLRPGPAPCRPLIPVHEREPAESTLVVGKKSLLWRRSMITVISQPPRLNVFRHHGTCHRAPERRRPPIRKRNASTRVTCAGSSPEQMLVAGSLPGGGSEFPLVPGGEDDLGHQVWAQPELLRYLIRPHTLRVIEERQPFLRLAPRSTGGLCLTANGLSGGRRTRSRLGTGGGYRTEGTPPLIVVLAVGQFLASILIQDQVL